MLAPIHTLITPHRVSPGYFPCLLLHASPQTGRRNARRLHGSTQGPDEVLRQARAAHSSRMASLARTNQVLDAHLRAHARRASAGRLQFEDAPAANRGSGGGGAPLMMSSVLVDLGGDMLTLGLMDARVDVMLDQEGLCMPRGVINYGGGSHGGGSSGGGAGGSSGGRASGGRASGCTASAATAADAEAKRQQRQGAARLVDDDEDMAAAAFAAAGAAAARRFVDSDGDEEGQGASSYESMEDGGDDGDDAGGSLSGAVAACPVSIGSEVPAIALPGAAAISPATTPGGAPRTCRNRRMSSGGADGIIALLQHHTARATAAAGGGAVAGFSGNPALTAAATARNATNTTAGVHVSAGSDAPWGAAAAAQAASTAAAAAATMAGDNSSPVSPRLRRRSALVALDLAAAGLAADPWSEAAAAALPGSAVHTLMLNQHYGGGQLPASQSPQQHPLVSPRRLRLPRASAPSAAGVAAGAAAAGGIASLPPSPRRAAGVSGCCGEGTAAAVAAADGAAGGARLCFGHAEVPTAPTSPPPVAVAHAWELQPQAGMATPSSPLRAATLDASVERAPPPLPPASPPAVFSAVSPSPPCSPCAGAGAMSASGGSCTSAASPLLVAPVARSGILSLSATHASRGPAASTSSADGAASAAMLPRHQQHQNPHQQREAPKQRQQELQQGATGWIGDAESAIGQRQRPPSGHRTNGSPTAVGTCEEQPVGEEPLAVMDVDVAAAELHSSAAAAVPLLPPPSPQPQLPQTHRAIARRETAPGAAAHPGASPSPSPPLRYGSGTALPGGAAASAAAVAAAAAAAAADNESVPAPGSPTAVLAPSSPNVRRRLAAAGSLTLQMPPPGLQGLQSTLQPLQPPQQLPRGHGASQGYVAPAAAAAAAGVLAQASPLAVVARASDGGAASNLPQRQQKLSLTCAQGGGSAVGGDVWALAEAATSPRVSAPVSPGPTAAATAATRIVTSGGAALAAPPAAPLSPAGHGIYVPPTSAGASATTGLPPRERQEFPVMAESYPLPPAARAKSSTSQGSSAAAATGAAWRPPALPAAATAARNRLAVAAPHGAYAHQYGRDGPASAPVIRAGAATASGGNAGVADGNGGSSASPVLLLSRRPELFRKGWSSSLNGSSSIARRGGILAAAAAGSSSSFTDGTTPIRKRMTAAATALEVDPIATATSTAAAAAASMTTAAGATVGEGGDGGDGGTAGMSVMRSGPAFSWGARRSSSSSGGGRTSLPPGSTATGAALQPSSCHPAHRPPSESRDGLLLRPARSATEAVPAPVPALMQPAAALPRSSAPHPPPLAPSEAREESEDQPAASSRLQQPEQHQHNQQPTGHRPLLLLHSSGTGALAPTSPRGLLSATTSITASTVAGPHSPRQQQSQLLPSTRAHPLLSSSSTSQPQSAQPAQQADRHTPRRQASSTHGGDRDSGPLAAEGSSFAASTAAAAAAAAAAPGARPSAAPVAPAAAWDKAVARAHTSVTPFDTEGREAAAVAAPSMARRFAALSDPQGLWGAEPAAPQHSSHPAPQHSSHLAPPRKCGAVLAVANTTQPQPSLQPQQPQQPLPPLPSLLPLQRPQEEAAPTPVPESLLPDKPGGQWTTTPQARADHRSSSSSSQRSRSARDEQPFELVTQPPLAVATGSSRTDGQEARSDAALETAVANEGPGGTARHVRPRRDGSDNDMVAPDAQHGTRAGASTGIAAEASATANNNGDCSSGSSGGGDGSGGGNSRAHIADSGSSGPAVGSTSVLARMKRALSTLRTYSTVY